MPNVYSPGVAGRPVRLPGWRVTRADSPTDSTEEPKIKADHVERVEDILFRLDNAMQPSDMDLPGWNLHKLSVKLKGFSAVWVSGNFRIWFRMEDGDAFDVDYGDYH
jgi:proteic killer suppression protein